MTSGRALESASDAPGLRRGSKCSSVRSAPPESLSRSQGCMDGLTAVGNFFTERIAGTTEPPLRVT